MEVKIRPLEPADALTSVIWRNDPEVFKYTGSVYTHTITLENEIEWINRVIGNADDYRCAIIADGKYVGNIYLTGIHDVYVLLSGAGVQFHNIHFIADGAGVQSTVADGRCSMHIIGRNLVIDSAGESTLEVYNAAGVLELSRRIGKGTSTVALQPGVHICRLSLVTDMPTFKAIIK